MPDVIEGGDGFQELIWYFGEIDGLGRELYVLRVATSYPLLF